MISDYSNMVEHGWVWVMGTAANSEQIIKG